MGIAFPLMVAAIVFIRKSFDWFNVFTQRELSWLDDVMPEEHKKDAHDVEKNGVEMKKAITAELKKKKKSAGDINISREIGKSDVWKNITKDEKIKDLKKTNFYGLIRFWIEYQY